MYIKSENDEEMYRQDANEEEIRNLLASTPPEKQWINLWRQFHTEKKPSSWVVWPHSKSKGWCPMLTGKL